MGEATDSACDVTAARLAAWAEDQGVPLDVMRTRVAGNRAAIAATAALMARMVAEAGTGPAPDQEQPDDGQDSAREDGPVWAGH